MPRSSGQTASLAQVRSVPLQWRAPRSRHTVRRTAALVLRPPAPAAARCGIDHLQRMRRVRPSSGAIWAGTEPGIGDAVRVRLQRPGHAGAAFARRLATGRRVRLLTLRWRQRRVVGRLRRPLQLRQPHLQLVNARKGRRQLPNQRSQRADQRILLRIAQRAEINVRCHANVESATKRCVNHLSLLNPKAVPQVSNHISKDLCSYRVGDRGAPPCMRSIWSHCVIICCMFGAIAAPGCI